VRLVNFQFLYNPTQFVNERLRAVIPRNISADAPRLSKDAISELNYHPELWVAPRRCCAPILQWE
jgi:hypothetical protein